MLLTMTMEALSIIWIHVIYKMGMSYLCEICYDMFKLEKDAASFGASTSITRKKHLSSAILLIG